VGRDGIRFAPVPDFGIERIKGADTVWRRGDGACGSFVLSETAQARVAEMYAEMGALERVVQVELVAVA
jgi:hypothetical protein